MTCAAFSPSIIGCGFNSFLVFEHNLARLGENLDIAKPVKRENKFEVSWFNSLWRMHKSYGFM